MVSLQQQELQKAIDQLTEVNGCIDAVQIWTQPCQYVTPCVCVCVKLLCFIVLPRSVVWFTGTWIVRMTFLMSRGWCRLARWIFLVHKQHKQAGVSSEWLWSCQSPFRYRERIRSGRRCHVCQLNPLLGAVCWKGPLIAPHWLLFELNDIFTTL